MQTIEARQLMHQLKQAPKREIAGLEEGKKKGEKTKAHKTKAKAKVCWESYRSTACCKVLDQTVRLNPFLGESTSDHHEAGLTTTTVYIQNILPDKV